MAIRRSGDGYRAAIGGGVSGRFWGSEFGRKRPSVTVKSTKVSTNEERNAGKFWHVILLLLFSLLFISIFRKDVQINCSSWDRDANGLYTMGVYDSIILTGWEFEHNGMDWW